jgi:hypothetical protein
MMNARRITPTLGTVVVAAFAAALIGLAPAARADTEPDPFENLLGTAGVNTWTPTADAELLSSNPTEAANLDASVDAFNADVTGYGGYQYDPLSQLVYEFDEGAFSIGSFMGQAPNDGGLPDNAIGDLAVGLDYLDWANGTTGIGTDLSDAVQIPYDIVIALVYLPFLPFILAAA